MVCRKKNIQLQNEMHKQSESRNKNQVFKDQLNSSHEPFQVVADYFGRGLFKKVSLEADDDDDTKDTNDEVNITRKVAQRPQVIPALSKTEGRVRLEETSRNNDFHKPATSEGRLRQQEQNFGMRPKIAVSVAQTVVPQKKAELKPKAPINYPMTANPFDSEEDDTNPFAKDDENYDTKKNPFGDAGNYFTTIQL